MRNVFRAVLAMMCIAALLTAPVFAQSEPDAPSSRLFIPAVKQVYTYPRVVVTQKPTDIYFNYVGWLTFAPPYELSAGKKLYVHGSHLVKGYNVSFVRDDGSIEERTLFTPEDTWSMNP